MEFAVKDDLKIVVDEDSTYCKMNPPHVNVLRNGKKVAQVWLKPISLKLGHELDLEEIDKVCLTVFLHKEEIEEQYQKNRIFGNN